MKLINKILYILIVMLLTAVTISCEDSTSSSASNPGISEIVAKLNQVMNPSINAKAGNHSNKSRYTISPALPTGLTLSSTTGMISGTPNNNRNSSFTDLTLKFVEYTVTHKQDNVKQSEAKFKLKLAYTEFPTTKSNLIASMKKTIKDSDGNGTAETNLTASLLHIDTSKVANFQELFTGNTYFRNFNADITGWDTSNVTNMSGTFNNTQAFNKNISKWDTSKVTTMEGMFSETQAFNQNISTWNTSNVTDMSNMFNNARVFNQNISTWNVAKVTQCTNFSGSTLISGNRPSLSCSTN